MKSPNAKDIKISFCPSVASRSLPERIINVNYFYPADVLSDACARAEKRQGYALATINLDHVVKLKNNEDFYQAYRKQDIVVADGFPIVWLGRIAGRRLERTAGSELVLPLMQEAAKRGHKVAIVGTTDEVLNEAKARLVAMYPGLKIVYMFSPPFGFDPNGEQAVEILEQVKTSGALICFIALGAPKQEILAAKGKEIAPETGFVSVGAGIDFITGKQSRAPRWARAINMEWFWRMVTNPALVSRYAKCAAVLPFLLIRASAARLFEGKAS